jgi:UPF0716 protein FxsA
MTAVMLQLQSNGARMRLPARLMLGFVIWLIAEVAAFALIVEILSFSGAILLCLMTSLAGAAMLRRLGLSAAFRLRKALANRSQQQAGLSREALLDGTLAGLGSILLILPGFVSDFIGLALAAPSIRFWVTERLRVGKFGVPPDGRRAAAPQVIELAPKDWSRLDETGSRARRTTQ